METPADRAAADARLAELLVAAKADDRAALDELVRSTAGVVRATLMLAVQDDDAIEDLAQETYLHVLEHLDEFTGGSVAAWLATIARYRALDWRRRQQRRRVAHGRFLKEVTAQVIDAVDQDAANSPPDALPRLRHCLSLLGEEARRLLEWRYREQLQPTEIAQRIGRSVGGVNVSLSRLRQRLSACMASGPGWDG